jgi:ABC-type protease/lipase transport system fused ATPase/permease subunit
MSIFNTPRKLLVGTAMAAFICDALLLIPFFFTSNLFVKILPSKNIWSLVILLTISVMSLILSKFYERLRTAGLIKIQRSTLNYFRSIENSLLFTGNTNSNPRNSFLLQTLMILKTNEFINSATAAFQIFFPILIFIITFYISFKLFVLLFIFLLLYGFIYNFLQSNKKNKQQNTNAQIVLKRISFFKWMNRIKSRMLLTGKKDLNSSIIKNMLDMSEANNFRYSASLVLLALCAILIIEESLPTGYLLPISFFGQRLIIPTEKFHQFKFILNILKIFLNSKNLSLLNIPKNSDDEEYGIDGLGLISPIAYSSNEGKVSLLLNQNVLLKNGQLLAVTGGSSSGKTLFVEIVLGLVSLKSGKINISSKSKSPWEYIRYYDQKDSFVRLGDTLPFYQERMNQLRSFFESSDRHVLIIDDPFLGADAKSRDEILELIKKSLDDRAIVICACNDKQLVDISSVWLAVNSDGSVAVRKDDNSQIVR